MEPSNEITLDVLTTSVGRLLVRETYESFFRHVKFDGRYNFIITVDRTYGVSDQEYEETLEYFRALRKVDKRVQGVTIETWDGNIGLQRSLMILFSHCRNAFGINLEDDWCFFADIDLNTLLLDLVDQKSTMIAFNNTHAAARGTFTRVGEVEQVPGTRVPLVRLISPSWASDYLPLCPHLHDTNHWLPAYTKALMLDDDPYRCPDERVKAFVRRTASRAFYNALWTKDIVVRDIGRDWLLERNQTRNIGPSAETPIWPIQLHLKDNELELDRSDAYLRRANNIIPGTTQTFLKRPVNFAPGHYPMFVDAAHGARVRDVDGNVYVDFNAGLGASLLGYNAEALCWAVRRQLSDGVLLPLPTLVEIEAAEALAEVVPGAEMVRFLKTGADAVSAAVRLARHITCRDKIAISSYHGWHDLFTTGTPGVSPFYEEYSLRFDIAPNEGDRSLEELFGKHRGEIACVIVSLPYYRIITAERLREIQSLAHAHGSLFVLDDIVTGFRLALGGAQEYCHILADIVCLGKALGAGMPISAVAGSRRIMEHFDELHVSSTYGGETLSLSVVIAAIKEYKHPDFYQKLWALGSKLSEGINSAAAELGMSPIVSGYGPIPTFRFSEDQDTHQRIGRRFLAETAKQGILFRRDENFITSAHSENDIQRAIESAILALRVITEISPGV